MDNYTAVILTYLVFIWFVIIHTFEEISQNVFELDLGKIKLNQKKYLIGASVITTINLGTLALIVSGNRLGLFFGIFTASVFGILQALVHTVGFFKEGRKAQNFGAGFYTSGPLAIAGGLLLYQILLVI